MKIDGDGGKKRKKKEGWKVAGGIWAEWIMSCEPPSISTHIYVLESYMIK